MPYAANTLIAHVDKDNPDPEIMALAGEVLHEGGLVAFPTETVYGLGANALSESAVAKIFEAKGRPATDPVIVHIYEMDDLEKIAVNIPEIAYTLAEKFWAGALTLILQKSDAIPLNVTAGGETVAVRMPSHPVAQALLRKSNLPIAAPSANLFSRPSPTGAAHVLHDLEGKVDVILDAGATSIGVESTIVDLTGETPVVLRPGGVSIEDLREFIPDLAYKARYLAENMTAPSPGTLVKHYSPDAQVMLFQGDERAVLAAMHRMTEQFFAEEKRVGILAMNGDALEFADMPVHVALMGRTDTDMAARLFAGLRALDEDGVDVILVRAPEQSGMGLAIWDRLLRAAEGHIISVTADETAS
ncbi:MAG: L-threonylcarbamoyladenylate synthase [Aggregatilineales bacterium]